MPWSSSMAPRSSSDSTSEPPHPHPTRTKTGHLRGAVSSCCLRAVDAIDRFAHPSLTHTAVGTARCSGAWLGTFRRGLIRAYGQRSSGSFAARRRFPHSQTRGGSARKDPRPRVCSSGRPDSNWRPSPWQGDRAAPRYLRFLVFSLHRDHFSMDGNGLCWTPNPYFCCTFAVRITRAAFFVLTTQLHGEPTTKGKAMAQLTLDQTDIDRIEEVCR